MRLMETGWNVRRSESWRGSRMMMMIIPIPSFRMLMGSKNAKEKVEKGASEVQQGHSTKQTANKIKRKKTKREKRQMFGKSANE